MSYKFYSPKTSKEQENTQWDMRSLDEEIRSFELRTIAPVFRRYMNPASRILEAGCGIGAWCEWFQNQGHHPIGIEYNQRVIAQAKSWLPFVSVEFGDVTQIAYPSDFFDSYVSLGVVEHFEEGPDQPLREAHRVLKPGGIAFVSTPCINGLRTILAHPVRSFFFTLNRLRGKSSHFWEYRFSKQELQQFLERNGFEVVEIVVDDFVDAGFPLQMGLWTDWFFLRKKQGKMWELNNVGQLIYRFLKKIVPPSFYCAGLCVVARAVK